MLEPKSSFPKSRIPKFRYKQVQVEADWIVDKLKPYIGTKLSSGDISIIAGIIGSHLKVAPGVLIPTLQFLLGVTLLPDFAHRIAYRISGNVEMLKRGVAVVEWTGQKDYEWVPVIVLDTNVRHDGSKSFFCLTMRILAGTPAGLVFTRCFPRRYMTLFMGDLGFGKDKWTAVVEELVGMRFRVLLMPGETLNFTHYRVPEKADNRKLLLERKKPCERGYTIPCIECPIGRDKCKFAVRPRTMEKRQCSGGHEGWFDPLYPMRTLCKGCYAAKERNRGRQYRDQE